jgi:quinol monooxygenase YgiN
MRMNRAWRARTEARMPYIRISLMTPKDGAEQEVAAIMDDLLSFYAQQTGYLSGYKLLSADEDEQIGRVTIWTDEDAADTTAQMAHVLSKRSELRPLIEGDSHQERSYTAAERAQPLVDLVAKRR